MVTELGAIPLAYQPGSRWNCSVSTDVLGRLVEVVSGRPSTTFFSGGGGLVSTLADYARFAQMLLNDGELDGARILSPTTVALMTTDHLHDDGASFLADGWGFGLGFTVKNQPALDGLPDSVGTYYWFGVAGTSFWIDPEQDLIGVFMIHINPNRDVNFRDQFKRLVCQAVVG
jgi:CubicO group peptidase (beta-lactamase class C family)